MMLAPNENALAGGTAQGAIGYDNHYVADNSQYVSAMQHSDDRSALVDEYIRHGWKLCPIPPGSKGSKTLGWNRPENALISADDLPAGWGVGLMHAASSTCAIDVDDLTQAAPMLKEHGIDLQPLLDAPDAVQIVSGKDNRAKLLYAVPPFIGTLPSKKIIHKMDGVHVTIYELRNGTADGLSVQCCISPTIHPETCQSYRWGGKGNWKHLPPVPTEFLVLWQSLIDQDRQRNIKISGSQVSASWDEIKQALEHISPDCSRDEWITVLMALHYAGTVTNKLDEALVIADEWSAQSLTKYKGQADIISSWRGFNPDKGVTLGSLFHIASKAGWVRPLPNVSGMFSPVGSDDWPDPQPIPSSLLPVAPFSYELLPTSLREWVADIANRIQCPPDFVAVAAMVALSSVVGRKATIRPKRFDDWQVVPNLWGGVVGRPGAMKSPALSEVMKPLDRFEIRAKEAFDAAIREFSIDSKIGELVGKSADSQVKQLVDDGKVDEAKQLLLSTPDATERFNAKPPALRRYKVTDASVEALGEILIENPWGTLSYRDELNGLLRSLDKPGQEGARAFYLQAYDGNQGYTFDRIARGKYLHIPAVCIAMLGGIQPGKLSAYIHDAVNGGAGDDGLLQRFGMLVWPDGSGEWRNVDKWPDTVAKQMAYSVFERLDAMAPGLDSDSGQEVPKAYQFTDDAQTLFEEWRATLETDLRSGNYHPAMESHLSKYRKLVPAIALICALADGETKVSRTSLERALAWAEYLKTHAGRAYAAGSRPATEGASALLKKIKSGAVADGFRPADVYLKGWSHLSSPETVHAAAELLCDLRHLVRVEQVPSAKGGRPSITFQINPKSLA